MDPFTMIAPIVGQAGGLVTEMVMTPWRQKQQLKQQTALTRIQVNADKELAEYNRNVQEDLAMDMWNNTNYGAQLEHMRKAGLNPSLLYSKGGTGGATASSAPGSVSSSQASEPNTGMAMQMGMQAANMMANLELVKAQTEKTKAEAANIGEGGVQNKGWQLDNIIKEFDGKEKKQYFEEISEPLRGVQRAAQEANYDSAIAQGDVIYNLWQEGKLKDKADAEIESILINNAKNEEEKLKVQQQIKNLKEELKGTTIDNAMKEIELKWQNGTGFKSQNIAEFASKILGGLILGKRK